MTHDEIDKRLEHILKQRLKFFDETQPLHTITFDRLTEVQLLYIYYEVYKNFNIRLSADELQDGVLDNANTLLNCLYQVKS